MARLTHVNGASVEVPDEKAEHLLRAGFRTAEAQEKPKRTTKKADTKSADDES